MSLVDRKYTAPSRRDSSSVTATAHTENYLFCLNKDLSITKTSRRDGNEEIIFRIEGVPKNTEVLEKILFNMEVDITNKVEFKIFKEACLRSAQEKSASETVLGLPLEERYTLLLKGAQQYIPSSLLREYEGTAEEKLLMFFSKTVR